MNPYEPPVSIREIAAPVMSDQERRRAASNRWTALFAIVSGIVVLMCVIVGGYKLETETKITSPNPEVQRSLDESQVRLRVSLVKIGALYGALSLAGVFIWRRNRWAPHMLAIVSVAIVARMVPTMTTSKEIAIFNLLQGAWLGYILYRAWRMHLASRTPG